MVKRTLDELVDAPMAHVLRMLGSNLVIRLARVDPSNQQELETWAKFAYSGERAVLAAYGALDGSRGPVMLTEFTAIVVAARAVTDELGRPSRRKVARYLRR